jgi:Protein of unknown function (DUF1706)
VTEHKGELIREEDQAWAELCGVLGSLSDDDLLRSGFTEEWTPKDMLAHLASWWAEAASELERMRFGTFRLERMDIDAINLRFHEANRDLDLHTVRAELAAARTKALDALWRLPEVTPQAEEWFRESGPLHYGEHLPDLRRFAERIASPAGP